MICELCKQREATDKHHYLPGASRNIPIGQADGAGRIQKLIHLCRECHTDVHTLTADRFKAKHKKPIRTFIRVSHKIKPLHTGKLVYERHISEEKKVEALSK